MYTRPTAPLPIGGVIDDAIKLYRASFSSCWVLSLIGSIVVGATAIYRASQLRGVGTLGNLARSADTTQHLAEALRQFSENFRGPGFLSQLLIYGVQLLIYLALFAQVNNVAQQRSGQSPIDAVAAGLRRLPGSIVAVIVFSVGIGIGFFLLLIPGFYLWGKLEFWLASIFADDVGAIEGLGRSWVATSGNWWRSVTIVSVALIIILVLELLATVVTGSAVGVMLGVYHSSLEAIVIATQVVSAILSVFVLPMIPAVMLSIYDDLKLRREGGDLAARANSLHSA
jgi:hypothetical protein